MKQWLAKGYGKTKYSKMVGMFLFPVILFLYPLLQINQGIDISDTTYSLGNYRFMESLDPMWIFATYLSNLVGVLFRQLPFGETLLGMNLYTGLLVSATALICYYGLSKWFQRPLVFAGLMIALGLCWCPTTILYNYLTYFFLAAGSLLLLYGILRERKVAFVLAGVCLGLNVMVRFSNLPQGALIVVLWFGGWVGKKKGEDIWKNTMLCLVGYVAAMGSVILFIMGKYGVAAYGEMIGGLFSITQEASEYTLFGMILSILSAYGKGISWLLYMIPCTLAGMILFSVKKGKYEVIKKAVYVAGIFVLLRFYLGRGMFTLRYFEYESVFQWMMLFLILSLLLAVVGAGGYLGGGMPLRVMGVLVLVLIIITPIGSNNYTFQNMNNMFLVAPYTLWAGYKLWLRTRKNSIHFPWQAFMITICLITFIQSVIFGMVFVFRDGTLGEKRVAKVEESPLLVGMYTSQEKADNLNELLAFWKKEAGHETEAVFFGDAPGLSYILDVPSAIFTSWPEIPSNAYHLLERALEELQESPPIILHNDVGKPFVEGEKSDLILDYIIDNQYSCVFENGQYKVYRMEEIND